MCVEFKCSEEGLLADSSDHGNLHFRSIKGEELHEYLVDYQLLKVFDPCN
jgi:hypothetical protein